MMELGPVPQDHTLSLGSGATTSAISTTGTDNCSVSDSLTTARFQIPPTCSLGFCDSTSCSFGLDSHLCSSFSLIAVDDDDDVFQESGSDTGNGTGTSTSPDSTLFCYTESTATQAGLKEPAPFRTNFVSAPIRDNGGGGDDSNKCPTLLSGEWDVGEILWGHLQSTFPPSPVYAEPTTPLVSHVSSIDSLFSEDALANISASSLKSSVLSEQDKAPETLSHIQAPAFAPVPATLVPEQERKANPSCDDDLPVLSLVILSLPRSKSKPKYMLTKSKSKVRTLPPRRRYPRTVPTQFITRSGKTVPPHRAQVPMPAPPPWAVFDVWPAATVGWAPPTSASAPTTPVSASASATSLTPSQTRMPEVRLGPYEQVPPTRVVFVPEEDRWVLAEGEGAATEVCDESAFNAPASGKDKPELKPEMRERERKSVHANENGVGIIVRLRRFWSPSA